MPRSSHPASASAPTRIRKGLHHHVGIRTLEFRRNTLSKNYDCLWGSAVLSTTIIKYKCTIMAASTIGGRSVGAGVVRVDLVELLHWADLPRRPMPSVSRRVHTRITQAGTDLLLPVRKVLGPTGAVPPCLAGRRQSYELRHCVS